MKDVLLNSREFSKHDKFRAHFKWINPTNEPLSEFERGYFHAKWKMKKPRNQGGKEKKRRGRKWKGLGKRELKIEWGITYFHRSLLLKGWRAAYIRERVRRTISSPGPGE